jgi:hypothetical protein
LEMLAAILLFKLKVILFFSTSNGTVEPQSIFQKIRSSVHFVVQNAQDAKINEDAIESFLKSLDPDKISVIKLI